jgi:DUF1680 family protein
MKILSEQSQKLDSEIVGLKQGESHEVVTEAELDRLLRKIKSTSQEDKIDNVKKQHPSVDINSA